MSQPIEFTLGDKNFKFTIEEEENIKQNILSIINEAKGFAEVKEKNFLTSQDYGYIIFLLAASLARKTRDSSTKINKESKILLEMEKMIEKISQITNTP